MAKADDKIEIENVNHPGKVTRVDAEKYHEVRAAMLQALPEASPGLDAKALNAAMIPRVSQALFPDGEKIAWWAKTVQLDLEAKGLIRREQATPLRWTRA